jgi:type I restriction enzyme, S subunit
MPANKFSPKRLGEILRYVRRPITPETDRSYSLIGVRWYAAGTHRHDTITGDALQAPVLWKVHEGDVIYNKMWTSKGAFAVVTAENSNLYGTSEYPTFETIADTSSEFLNYAFNQSRFWKLAEAWTNGTTERARLSPRDFLRLPLPIPTPAEQRAIAGVLRAVEEAIARAEALIDTIGKAKHATMRELLTRGVRRDKAPLKTLPARWVLGRVAENITHIPRDWELVTLTTVAKLESGHTPDRKDPTYWGGKVPWILLQDADALGRLTISETAEMIGPAGLANSSARMLPAGTVVLQRTANIGLASIMEREMCTSQHFANWVCGSRLDRYYLEQVFRHMSREWQRLMAGSVLPDIYMGTFKALQILLPPMAEQKQISAIGAAFDRRLEHERDTLEILIENRAALARELLSGRLRLPKSIIARYHDVPAAAA